MSPELILLGITQPEPWAPEHTVGILKLLTFHLSWNWAQDLFREVLLISDLEDLVEEIIPFTANYSTNMVTIVDTEDIKGTPHWSDETLSERYLRDKKKRKPANVVPVSD